MSYQKLLEEAVKLEKAGIEIVSLKEMILDFISKEESSKVNKSNKTDKLQKAILAYLKSVDETKPYKKVKYNNNGYHILNGYSAFILNPELNISGIPVTNEVESSAFPDLTKLFNTDSNTKDELIDMNVLNQKIALMKAMKTKTVGNNEELVVNICGRTFNPLLVKEAISILGEIIEIKTYGDADTHPIEVYSAIGKGVILPVKIRK